MFLLFWLIKDVDFDITHMESKNENWFLYNTGEGDYNNGDSTMSFNGDID